MFLKVFLILSKLNLLDNENSNSKHLDSYFSQEDFNFNYQDREINAYEIFKESYCSLFENFNQDLNLNSQIKEYLFTILNTNNFSFNINLEDNGNANQANLSK